MATRASRRLANLVLFTAPWRRAPLLLRRQPGVIVAVVSATVILAVAGASAPLFLASMATATLNDETREDCPEAPLPQVTNNQRTTIVGSSIYSPGGVTAQDPGVRTMMRESGLPQPYQVLTTLSETYGGRVAPGGFLTPTRIFARDGAEKHVDMVSALPTTPRNPVWISDLQAEGYGVKPGDAMTIGPLRYPVTVAGVYKDLQRGGQKPSRYWCQWENLIIPTAADNDFPVFMITTRDTLLAAAGGARNTDPAGTLVVISSWFSPIDTTDLTVSGVQPDLRRIDDLRRRASEATGPSGYVLEAELSVLSSMRGNVDRANLLRDGLRGPIVPVAVVGTLVALLLVGAAGGYWAERRRQEVRLLLARGVSPMQLGGKALLEMAAPALAGLALGWVATIELVRRIGPSDLLEPDAPTQALEAVAVVGASGLLLLGWVAALRSGTRADGKLGMRAQVLRLVPWELVLLGLAALAYAQVHDQAVQRERFLIQIPPLLVAFPLLALAGTLLLVARLVGWAMPRLRRWTARLPTAGYLASRRMTARPTVTLALLVATAVPAGVMYYAATLTASTEATVEAKARTNLGADHVVVTGLPPGETPATGGHGTVVSVVRPVVVNGDTEGELLGVDPETFADHAAGDVTGDLPGLARRLTVPGQGEPVPAILVNARDNRTPAEAEIRDTTLPVRIVAERDRFPGMRFGMEPTLVVNRAALGDLDPFAQRREEIWTTHEEYPALQAAIRAADVPVFDERQPDDIVASTTMDSVQWIFGYLRALAVLVAVIAAAGLLLYLAARQRSRIASYMLGQRMGVTRRRHLASLVLEIGTALVAGFALGIAVAFVAVLMVLPLFDVNPTYPPESVLTQPYATVGAVLAAIVAVTVVCALIAQHTADRARPAEVMRLGD